MANIAEGFELVTSGIAEGFELVDQPPKPPIMEGGSLDQYKDLLIRRAHGEGGLDDQISGLYTNLSEQRAKLPPREIPQPTQEQLDDAGGGNILEGMKNMVTGADRMTPEMESLPYLGEAPEMNEFSGESLKSNLATFTTGDEKELKQIFKKQFGDKVKFREDEKKNTIVQFESGDYPLNKPGLSPQDVPKFMADLLAFSPAGRAATIPGAITKSAIGESVLEGSDVALGGEFDPKDVAVSTALGGGFKALEDVVSSAYRLMKGTDPKKADELLIAAKDAKIPITTTDALPPQTFAGKAAQQTTEKIPVAGTGGIREAQQKTREIAISKISEKYGTFSYKSIVDSLRESKDKIKNAAGSVLEKTGKKLDDALDYDLGRPSLSGGGMPMDRTKSAISSASRLLEKPGVIKSKGAMGDLETLIKAIDEAPQTFTSLKENRTAFREIVKGADKAERSQLTSRAKSILQNVEKAMTTDMRDFAKKNLSPSQFKKWMKANSVYGNEAEKMVKTKLKNILDTGDIQPEAVEKMLLSKKPSELKLLHSSLGIEGRKNARAAIISKIVSNLSKRAGGITPNTFATELGKNKDQINAFFKGAERKQLKGLEMALNATRRAQDAAATSVTGQQAIGGATVAAVMADPITSTLTGATLGTIARVYESEPVRNALLRLASTAKGSSAFEKALQQVSFEIRFASQGLKEASTDDKKKADQ